MHVFVYTHASHAVLLSNEINVVGQFNIQFNNMLTVERTLNCLLPLSIFHHVFTMYHMMLQPVPILYCGSHFVLVFIYWFTELIQSCIGLHCVGYTSKIITVYS